MTDLVTIKRAAEVTGYTEKAIARKIESGVWLEGVVWRYAPDGRRLISLVGYQSWAEGLECASLVKKRSSLTSAGKASDAGNVYDLHRRKPTSRTAEVGNGE